MAKHQAKSASANQSKFLSLVLRHEPDVIGITLDPAGWVDVDELLARLGAHGHAWTRAELGHLVAGSDKQRFAFSDDGRRIRANQGHSVAVELGHAAAAPPALLYHGTPVRNASTIRAQGLRKMERHHVHLSTDPALTLAVGARRGPAMLLSVRSGEMAAAGHVFLLTPNRVWLTEAVPARFIDFPVEA